MRRRAGGALRWLVTAVMMAAVAARLDSNGRSYPLKVHQLFLQQRPSPGVSLRQGSSATATSSAKVGGVGGNGGGGDNGGAWAPWSRWSACSRSCGGGVAAQTRECRPAEKRRRRLAEAALRNSSARESNGGRPPLRLALNRALGLHAPPPHAPPHAPPRAPVCVGVYKRFHICNDQPCPPGAKDFRLQQCEAFNRKPMAGHYYSWVPYLDAPNPCELNCRPVGAKFYARLNASVVDGTPCPVSMATPPAAAPAARAVCVAAACKAVGCDGAVGSLRRVDACGECGGANTTCRLVSGLFTRAALPRVGYHLVASVPRAACNLSVTELRHSRNFLALRRQDGSYVMNGNWGISWSGDYEAAGTRVTYRRQDAGLLETVTAPGPLTEPLDIMVLFQQPNPGIKYEYSLPMKAAATGEGGLPPPPQIAPPLLVPPAPLQPPAAGAVTGRSGDSGAPDVLAADAADTGGDVDRRGDVQGTESQPPPPQPRSRGRRRKFAWRVLGVSECSRTCGGGVQSALVACVREHGQLPGPGPVPVPDRRCAGLPRPPSPPLRCANKPCPAQWSGGAWGACSVSCGAGVQSRQLVCEQQLTPSLTMAVAAGACLAPEPTQEQLPRTRRCTMPACDAGAGNNASGWRTGPWTHCSSVCGPGQRTRVVHCATAGVGEGDGGLEGEGEGCPAHARPADSEPCDAGPCGANDPAQTLQGNGHAHSQAIWLASEWAHQCSAPCGTGVQARRVLCWPGPDESSCDVSLRPAESRACASDKQCPGQWFTGPWGQCSARCGKGRQTRATACIAIQRGILRVVPDGSCAVMTRPEHERSCLGHECGPDWFAAEWSTCSQECGGGVQRREVKCLDQHQRPSTECSDERRPITKRTCNTHECGTLPNGDAGGTTDNRLKDDPTPSRGSGDQAPLTDEKAVGDGDCVDRMPNCHLVVQARLCTLSKLYRTSCCHSCRKKL